MNTTELGARYDSRQSFYGKAQVTADEYEKRLYSYGTHVATLFSDKNPKGGLRVARAEVYGQYSQTTMRHIKEFLKQYGFRADNAKQIMADYGVDK